MSSTPSLQLLREQIHVSASEIRTFLGCPLQHHFRYIERRTPERLSIALPFGKSIHTALERYYETLRTTGEPEALSVLQEIFSESLRLAVRESEAPVLYKKEMPDLDSALLMGNAMLKAFHDQVDLSGFKVLAVEVALSAPLISPAGENLDINLLGVIDLLLEDDEGNLAVVDHKSARNSFNQADLDQDLQLGAYAYLLYANGSLKTDQTLHCRFDVLRKLKAPKLELCPTTRTWQDARRFAGIAQQVLAATSQRICYPARSWLCTDCAYSQACRSWQAEEACSLP